MTDKELMHAALEVRANAYAPYSGYLVGAALLAKDGRVFVGCNVENASYGVTNCAERTALFSAIAAGVREFMAIAIVGGRADAAADQPFPPCGTCRQALAEFCGPDMRVLLRSGEEITVTTLADLLPQAFQLEGGR